MKLTITLFLAHFQLFALTGLKLGSESPLKSLKTIEGETVNLTENTKPVVLVFYRGAWCPYCIKQLESLESQVAPKLKDKAKLVAISVDRTPVAKKMKDKRKLSYAVVSDPSAKTLKAFKIANKLNDELVKKYKSTYKIDVEADSGKKHHLVAHPAVYVIKAGKISYVDIHTDYKQRTKNDEILKAVM